jgi:hypothetical protein
VNLEWCKFFWSHESAYTSKYANLTGKYWLVVHEFRSQMEVLLIEANDQADLPSSRTLGQWVYTGDLDMSGSPPVLPSDLLSKIRSALEKEYRAVRDATYQLKAFLSCIPSDSEG